MRRLVRGLFAHPLRVLRHQTIVAGPSTKHRYHVVTHVRWMRLELHIHISDHVWLQVLIPDKTENKCGQQCATGSIGACISSGNNVVQADTHEARKSPRGNRKPRSRQRVLKKWVSH